MKPAQLSAASLLNSISQGESAFIEFKISFQKEVIETLTAFANTQGGAVLIGVSDAGQVVGVSIGNYRSANDSTIFKEFETTLPDRRKLNYNNAKIHPCA